MIQIECDNCEELFETDDEDAGGKVACPHCGDVNRVPEASARSEAPSSSSEEQAIRTIRPAMFRAHPFRGLVLAILFIAGAWLAIGSKAAESIPEWTLWPGLIMVVGIVGYCILWWIQTTLWIRVEVSNKRTVKYEGIVRRHSTEVLHDHVRSVDIDQNFIQRIFGVGYIGIDSAGQDGIEIEIRDIPNPYEVKEIVDKFRKM